MELHAIAEALDFIPKTACYVIIESDSEGCLHMMLGAWEVWMANNYINLKGERTKNKNLVDRIVKRLRELNPQFRKVKGHSNDQWNDRADALAVMGRNEAMFWPKRSFEIRTDEGRTPFHSRATRPSWTLQNLLAQFATETLDPLPDHRALAVFKDSKPFNSLPRHYIL
jgi:ribonuclease HI